MSKPKPAPLPAGTVVGGYQIIKKLAAGGFGVVYLAEDEQRRLVALKEYLPASLAERSAGELVPRVKPDKQPLYRLIVLAVASLAVVIVWPKPYQMPTDARWKRWLVLAYKSQRWTCRKSTLLLRFRLTAAWQESKVTLCTARGCNMPQPCMTHGCVPD